MTEAHQWHTKEVALIEKELRTSKRGLSQEEADKRLIDYGVNEIRTEKGISPFEILLFQFKDALILLLLFAAGTSVFLGEITDSIVISAIVIVSVSLGFVQEYRAEKAAEALKKLVSPIATVIRDGSEKQIDAKNLIPGDVLKVISGDRITGDIRLFKVDSLQIDESPLTGESTSVEKDVFTLKAGIPLADRVNMAYSGTVVTYGRGLGIVVATGMNSEFGKIAGMLHGIKEEKTPLQKRMEEIGKWLIAVSVLVVTIVSGLGIVRGYELFEMFLWGVSLAVAAVPEALPAVVTGSLAIGMRKMAEKKAIVKRLPAVETLGSTTVICSDKTGTLTKGEMTVKRIYYSGRVFNISGTGYSPEGEVENVEMLKKSNLAKIAVLCNDSRLIEENHNYRIKGQPTEGALLIMAIKLGESPDKIRKEYPEIAAIPFSSKRKRMTTIHQQKNGKKLAAVKGAPEIILKLCNWILEDGKVKILDQKRRKQILNINNEMASQALRIIALAYRELSPGLKRCTEECEKGLIFVGLTGMIDPPREEVNDSIKKCEKAGIRVIMITGDNRLTALAIAKELGIALKDEAIDGHEISKLTKDELSRYLDFVNVYARVSPEHKMKIVRILKDKGEIVAVTGDGVNDAPALKKSDIGVAMGITGTEVSKEAADMVLMDDNFTTIVSAIEGGRGTFDNIKKYLSFLLSSNTGEILIMFIAGIIGLPLPLIALQILWVNLVTDGLPAIALGVDPPEPDIMERKPRSSRESVFDLSVKSIIFTVGILMAISSLIVFQWYLRNPLYDLKKAQTMVFTIIVMFEILNALNCRSLRFSLTKIDPFRNRYLLIAVISSVILQLLVIYVPSLNSIFNTKGLDFNDWLIVIIASIPSILGVEVMKILVGKYQKN